MLSSDANPAALYDAAMKYAALGFSVIPIYGNVSSVRAKVAATDWGHFQRQHATQTDFDRWFRMYALGGVALVTGRISRLLVLDFDQIETHHQFVAAFPHLCDTHIVTSATRRLPHYYYRLPAGTEIASRKMLGLDLLAEGRYVIAPPTQLADQRYTITQDRTPLTLSISDVTALLAFMEAQSRQLGQNHTPRGMQENDSAVQQDKPLAPCGRGVGGEGYNVSVDTLWTADAQKHVPTHSNANEPSTATFSSRLVSAAHNALHTLRQAAHDIIADPLPIDSYGRVGELRLADANDPAYGHLDALWVKADEATLYDAPIGTHFCASVDPQGKADVQKHVPTTPIHTGVSSHLVSTDTVSQMAQGLTRTTVSAERLIQQYQQIAVQIGRNEALFRMAIRARDFGWSQAAVEETLTPAHVHQPASGEHVSETPRQRSQEAMRTIASVFKRPARPAQYAEAQVGLPVSVREALLSLKQMPLLRVLDGLILKGIVAGARLTEKFVTGLLEGIIGRHSVLKALKTMLPDGTAAFAPSPRTPTHTSVATEVTLFPGQKMLFVGVTESNKNGRGRPEQAYEMPSIGRLCTALGVKYTASDPVTANDLSSPKRTRQAMHRELLRRRPGLYSRSLLAKRLSVSVRSVQRYHRGADVRVRPAFRQREIFWETLSVVPRKDDVPAYSTFLQDEAGKRYPLDISIVKWLLKQNKRVFLMYQLPNHYSVSADTLSQETPPATPREQAIGRILQGQFTAQTTNNQVAACSHKSTSQGISEGQVAFTAHRGVNRAETGTDQHSLYHEESSQGYESYPQTRYSMSETPQGLPTETSWRYTPAASTRMMGQDAPSPMPADALLFTPTPHRAAAFVPQSERAYREPLASMDLEHGAQRLYEMLRTRGSEKTGYMTLAKARALLDQFGSGAVKKATHLLAMRRNVSNPAGFLISVLRSNAKLAGVLA